MKKFLEQYGLITCSAIIIMLFLNFSYAFSDTFKSNLNKTVEIISNQKSTVQQEAILINSLEFNDLLAENIGQAKIIHFSRGLKVPTDIKTTDFSEPKDKSILGWLDGDVYYINSENIIKAPEELYNMFSGYDYDRIWPRLQNVETVVFDNFDTSNTVSFDSMFVDSNIKQLDLSSFDTRKATNISYMFYNCKNLTNINLSSFNTQNVVNMSHIFANCESLKTINVSSFNTINVTDLSGMFKGCSALKSIDLKTFDTSNVENFSNMFELCNLDYLDLSKFNTAKATNMFGMFEFATIPSLDLSTFNTSMVEDMAHMFRGSRIPDLNINGFHTGNVKFFYAMFEYTEYATLNLDHFDTSKATHMNDMFNRCLNLQSLTMKNANTANVSNFKGMFQECNALNSINMNFDFSNAQTTEQMFYSCYSLNANITINKVPNNYDSMFGFSNKIIVNYTKDVEPEIDKILQGFAKKGSLIV